MHFANNGRCKNGSSCLFPHVRVGNRAGVCRDFAVLGYCDRGVDCDKQHVRECPDFAENGTCPNAKCKLPHVIRANRRRTATAPDAAASVVTSPKDDVEPDETTSSAITDVDMKSPGPVAQDASIGDEFISLTFHESDDSDAESDEGSEDEEDVDAEGGDEDAEGEEDLGDDEHADDGET